MGKDIHLFEEVEYLELLKQENFHHLNFAEFFNLFMLW